jgi:ApaG protein
VNRACQARYNLLVSIPAEAITRGFRIRVQSTLLPERSDPENGRFFFLYKVEMRNDGSETLKLLSRHWIIADANGHVEEVRGPGVVGENPTLAPGESFEYVSACPITTPFGVMHGTYEMEVTGNGERFDAEIPAFALGEPTTVH